MPRTFIAFALSPPNQERLSRIRTDLDWDGADIKWVTPQNIHLTLRFLGNVSEKIVEDIIKGLPDACAGLASVPVDITRLGAFPSASRAKVIWAGMDDPDGKIAGIYRRVQEFLSGIGIPPEDRAFAAHVTLGRVRRMGARQALKNTLSAFVFEPPLQQSLNRIVFYQSTLSSAGPIYTALGEVVLKDPSTPRK